MRRIIGENRNVRIEKRLKSISEIYNLVFDIDEIKSETLQLKKDLNLVNDETELVNCCV